MTERARQIWLAHAIELVYRVAKPAVLTRRGDVIYQHPEAAGKGKKILTFLEQHDKNQSPTNYSGDC